MSERNSEIIKMRTAGHSLNEISKAFGISNERVRQIIAINDYREMIRRNGFPMRDGLDYRVLMCIKRSLYGNPYRKKLNGEDMPLIKKRALEITDEEFLKLEKAGKRSLERLHEIRGIIRGGTK